MGFRLERVFSPQLALLAQTLVALGLRIYGLDHQPLRGDGSFTIQFSACGLDWLLPDIADLQPNTPL